MPAEFYPGSLSIYRYMVSGVRVQRPGAFVLTPEHPKPFGSRIKKVKKMHLDTFQTVI
jgi:hypothetical protein